MDRPWLSCAGRDGHPAPCPGRAQDIKLGLSTSAAPGTLTSNEAVDLLAELSSVRNPSTVVATAEVPRAAAACCVASDAGKKQRK
uniref:Uncharacterized protein n=1 Tax=Setaria viridis TaxID=4556 RepID=A0A4U6UD48_SETVI|nr:hypothetical protein SEVIR_5G076966v2 [Setaria viridis]